MTDSMLATARKVLPGVVFEGWTSVDGPPAIQGREDGERAIPPMLDLVWKAYGFGMAVVIGCFDDTGLAEAKAKSPIPVVGIGEASFHMARLLGHRFSVVTTLPVSIPIIEENIRAGGFADICGRVRASDIPVLELEADPAAACAAIAREAEAARREDDVTAIVLGCAGMTGLEAHLSGIDAHFIDPVASACRLAHALTC
ncbi:HyuE hydantoin racemase [Algicella marina]|uniref:HyuE hydantoin racemase n=2 Tax=Algicella marina TaxID=2683284 RepID=A0A6P1T312_9RHOB|nr:aspartate/glutamate racemase family protein [Algicella marina]QHQ37334.1 HyuE hydantoin racemase [Algicella marina]